MDSINAFCLWGRWVVCSAAFLFCDVLRADPLSVQDEHDPFYVGLDYPKLTTPQWVGDEAVDAVVVLAIDDMRAPERYEEYLRPILKRLQQIDGGSHVSIMTNAIDPAKPRYQSWLEEGVSLEVHTLTHPCPLLQRGDFSGAADTYYGGIDLLNHVPGNVPVAFRMPCCDSINSPSPRFYAELFPRSNPAGQFLQIDSSVMCSFTSADPSLPKELVLDESGKERFQRYLPFESFVTTIENYPYPYVIEKVCWEFPCMVPSDWEAQNIQGNNHPDTVRDWKIALDLTVLKQGVFNLVFHPHGWIRNQQVIEFIDYAQSRYGKRVLFLSFPEALGRINQHLLGGRSLRSATGADNGVRLVDLNQDGYLDVTIGNGLSRATRVWNATKREWQETGFPADHVMGSEGKPTGVKFVRPNAGGDVGVLVRNDRQAGAWAYRRGQWVPQPAWLRELRWEGQAAYSRRDGQDTGLRVRDVDGDGDTEVILGSGLGQRVMSWSEEGQTWRSLGFGLPMNVSVVDGKGRDNGVRFVDINGDGLDDVVQSNDERYSLHLYIPETVLGFQQGWSREVLRRHERGDHAAIPKIVTGEEHRRNGAWFHSGHMWIQNEHTAALPDLVDRRAFTELLRGEMPAPTEPRASLELFEIDDAMIVELVAAEPLLADPVSFDWSPDGTLWVVEMGDYPSGVDGRGAGGGRVRRLRDTNHDGLYDQSVVFLEGLNFPTGVMPWGRGVLVSAAPDILYAEDRDGDGRADFQEVWYTGFVEGNQQHRVNGFEYGLDNWIYGANGDSGGSIRQPGEADSVSISRRDWRFHPVTRRFEAVEGQTQFGRRRDDWGHWFGNNNPNWLWHYWFPDRYLAHNPFLVLPGNKQYLGREHSYVYGVGKSQQRFNDVGKGDHVTAGNSPTPYRDDLFSGEYLQSVFVSEPVHHVVHREVLLSDGVTFTSRRGNGEERREFLASHDPWFRPTGMRVGPDGALYVADMYRLVIEHPEWIPADAIAAIDLRSGHDRGRLYRIRPKGVGLRTVPDLVAESTPGLVAQLANSSGWVRDTAQRLLVYERGQEAVPALRAFLEDGPNDRGLLHALWALQGLGALEWQDVVRGLESEHPGVRRNAVRLSEPFMSQAALGDTVRGALRAIASDGDAGVRFQLALSLSQAEGAGWAPLWFQLSQGADDDRIRLALECALPRHLEEIAQGFGRRGGLAADDFWLADLLIRCAIRQRDSVALRTVLERVITQATSDASSTSLNLILAYLDELRQRDLKADPEFSLIVERQLPVAGIGQAFYQVLHRQRVRLDSSEASAGQRVLAWRLLLAAGVEDLPFSALFSAQGDSALQEVVLRGAQGNSVNALRSVVRQNWTALRPRVRQVFADRFVRTEQDLLALIDALSAGEWTGLVRVERVRDLVQRSDDAILSAWRDDGESDQRLSVDEMLREVFPLKPEKGKGREVFVQNCSVCHQYDGVGNAVGPDLRSVSDRSTRGLVEAIMNPNRAVESKYLAFTVETRAGDVHYGIVEDETEHSLTLRKADGQLVPILRQDLTSVESSQLSLMPEGLGAQIGAKGLADLIAYLQD